MQQHPAPSLQNMPFASHALPPLSEELLHDDLFHIQPDRSIFPSASPYSLPVQPGADLNLPSAERFSALPTAETHDNVHLYLMGHLQPDTHQRLVQQPWQVDHPTSMLQSDSSTQPSPLLQSDPNINHSTAQQYDVLTSSAVRAEDNVHPPGTQQHDPPEPDRQ